jgi:heme exporter protein CcmB
MIASFLRVAWHVMRKDITVEVRSLEILSTTMLFSITVVLMFSFGLVRDGRPVDDVAAAILWIAIAFSGTLALGRTFERERHNDTLRALMLAPADRPALYAGKLAGILLLLGLVELVLVPLVGLFFNAPVFKQAVPLSLLLITGTLGFCAVGTLFAAMLVRARSRDVLLPVMLYPMTVPVMIAGVRGTTALFQPVPEPAVAQFWLGLLVAFDVVFVILALWTFEPVMTD